LDIVKSITLDYLNELPVGSDIKKALGLYEKVQNSLYALATKDESDQQTLIKMGTVLAISLLDAIWNGKKISDLSNNDWEEIANSVNNIAIMKDGRYYSAFVFEMYARYIDYSVALILGGGASQNTADKISSLSEELRVKKRELDNECISEPQFVEDCLYISLEAMIKLLSSTMGLFVGGIQLSELSEAVASFAFEYARYTLFKQEQELLDEYLEHQHVLDAELEQRFREYTIELNKNTDEFMALINNAFEADFRNRLVNSVSLARHAGVEESEILDSVEKIDSFFMD